MKRVVYRSFSLALAYPLRFLAFFLYSADVRCIHEQIKSISKSLDENRHIDGGVLRALIIAEDHRYLWHYGVDFFGICRATIQSCYGVLQGASTIEQQLIRTLTGCYEVSIMRKMKEILLAATLINAFEKKEIIFVYLYQAYFGAKRAGILSIMEMYDPSGFQTLSHYCAWIVAHLKYPLGAGDIDSNYQNRVNRMERIVSRIHVLEQWVFIV